ncbi:MAG: hypothetical protein EYC69_03880 [Bacteroidetes bacterium]|nr:MAG: hypothetical protein EYC69_03880 [Bacteroidota bacterium]
MKRKSALLFLTGIMFQHMIYAQKTFTSTYEAPDGMSIQSSVIAPGNYIYSGGSTTSFGAIGTDIILVKTDIDGNLHWSKTIGSARDEGIVTMIYTTTNKLALISDDASFNPQIHTFMILDTSRTVLSSRSFSMDGIPYHQGSVLMELSSGDFLLCSSTNDGVVLVCLDNAGNTNWTRSYSSAISPSPFFHSVSPVQLANGNIAIACTGAGGSALLDQIILLITDNSGNYISAQHYISTVGIAATKLYYSPASDKIYLGGTANDSRFFAMKLDPSGSIVWSIAYLSTFMSFVQSYDIAFNPLVDELSFVGSPSGGGFEIAKLDSAGNYLWSQGSSGFTEIPSSISYEPSGSLIITGMAPSTLTTNLNLFHCRLLADGTRCTATSNLSGFNSGYSATEANTSYTLNPAFSLLDSAITFTTQNNVLGRVT